jgi:hypothetical protein
MASANQRRARQKGSPAGAAYDRERDLPRLVMIWPEELRDTSVAGRQRIVALINRALRYERRRGLAKSWSYDLGRHRALVLAARAERDALLRVSGGCLIPARIEPLQHPNLTGI